MHDRDTSHANPLAAPIEREPISPEPADPRIIRSQAYAEGLDILRCAAKPEVPADQRYDFDLADITELWRRGSVVTSWLLDLTAQALVGSPDLAEFAGKVSDSGEGRWALAAANDEAVPAHVLTAALFERFASRGEDDFQNKVLSAMRKGFGGHAEKK